MKKSLRITTILSCVVMFLISIVLSITLYVFPVKAASSNVFEMEYGASVKLSTDGLRFKVRMSQDYYDKIVTNDTANQVKLYGYIAPVEQIASRADNYQDFIEHGTRVGGVLDESKIYYRSNDGYYYANIALTNLGKYNYQGKSFSAIGFIEDTSSGLASYTYADYAKGTDGVPDLNNQTRTQYQVINSAMLDGEKSYEKDIVKTYTWYGVADSAYPIIVNTAEDYDTLVAKMAGTADLADKEVYVKETVADEKGTSAFENVKGNGHVVTYYDGYTVVKVDFVEDGADSTPADAPKKDGYKFVEWLGNTKAIKADQNVYAKWKFDKGEVSDIGNMKVYGVTLANGGTIAQDDDVLGQKVVLAAGDLGNGAYYPGVTQIKDENGATKESPDPTDEEKTADQAYLAYDGNYGFNDYFVADFTGKNMPTLAFFANNYNNSIFYGDGNKNGVVVATGLTWPDGRLFTEDGQSFCTSVFNGKGLCMWGPHMIYSTAKNALNTSQGVLLHGGDQTDVALGRANLVDGTKYRVIMGMQPGDDLSNKAIKLVYNLYNLDTNAIVESKAINTYNFFTDGWANKGQTRDQFCSGSIVAYGYFGTATVLDKTYPIYEDTTINEIAEGFGMPALNNVTVNGESFTLGNSNIGDSAHYSGSNNQSGVIGTVNQSYLAFNGNYGFNDYVVFDFTGKNMPSVAFFANNYNESMYYQNGDKYGLVVLTGLTTYQGVLYTEYNDSKSVYDGTGLLVCGPQMLHNTLASGKNGVLGFQSVTSNSDSNSNVTLGRANLDDSKQYRVIMGMEAGNDSRSVKIVYALYSVTDEQLLETFSAETHNYFIDGWVKEGQTRDQFCQGSIVLYGHFGTPTNLDKVYGVYEDTTIADIMTALEMNMKTVTFQNYDGTVLDEINLAVGSTPEYTGATPVKPADAVMSSYEFAGWDKEIAEVTNDVTYTAVFTGTYRENVSISGGSTHTYGVEQSGNKIVLKASNIGNSAHYSGSNNQSGVIGTVNQSYLAFDGNYGFNDYVAFDFTGKNMPSVAFFANNYNDSMYYQNGDKYGLVVLTGLTTWQGVLYTEKNDSKSVYDGKGLLVCGPQMLHNTLASGKNGVLGFQSVTSNSESSNNVTLGRANLDDSKQYRVIMGMEAGNDSRSVKIVYALYNVTDDQLLETFSAETYNYFTNGWVKEGQTRDQFCQGSIVLYGHFGTPCTIDKIHGVFEDTTIGKVAAGLNGSDTYTVTFVDGNGITLQEDALAYGAMPAYVGTTPTKAEDMAFAYTFIGWDKEISLVTGAVTYTAQFEASDKEGVTTNNVTVNGEGFTLGNGNIGDSAHYSGSNNQSGVIGTVNQSYLAFDGNYGFNDYVVFDFTGKNMPSVAFFANNYNESMYYQNGDKYGLVVLTGLTTWQGVLYTEHNDSKSVYDGKGLLVCGPQMLHNTLASGKNGVLGFQSVTSTSNSDSNSNVTLGRANLDDSKQYRVVMGMEAGNDSRSVKIVYALYNVTDDQLLETFSAETYNYFTDGWVKEGQTRDQFCQGSIVLYGHFGTPTNLDKVYGVYENTTLTDVLLAILPTGEGTQPETPTSNAPDYSKYTDKFDFYAYSCYSDGTYEIDGQKYYVGKNLANLKQYGLYGGVGMTIYYPQNDMLIDGTPDSIAKAKALIDDLAKVGIQKTILQDSRILGLSMQETAIVGNGLQFADEAALDAYIYNCVKDYASYPGVYGVQLGDEPKYACLAAYSAVYKSIKRVNEKYGFNLFIQYNLNPLNVTKIVYENYYPASQGTYEWENYRYTLKIRDRFTDCVTRYTQYINDFLNAMDPDSIMYDDYPLMETKNGSLQMRDSYIPCLQIVAKAAADRGIKFYNVTQAFENNADGTLHRRQVTEAGAKWLNNILLGFGAKQIAYYTYYTRSESDASGGESYVDGSSFVDYNGNPTDLYYTMKDILADNQIFASTILQFDYVGSHYYKGKSASTDNTHVGEITVANTFSKLTSFSVDKEYALVTELYDDENDNYMYMAMNIVDPSETVEETLTLTFSGYTHALVYRDGEFTKTVLDNYALTATVAPGEAVFVIPYN